MEFFALNIPAFKLFTIRKELGVCLISMHRMEQTDKISMVHMKNMKLDNHI